jgi:hypothetical protein
MFQKLGEAIGILFSNIALFTLVILTVWLPGNILINLYIESAEKVGFYSYLSALCSDIMG